MRSNAPRVPFSRSNQISKTMRKLLPFLLVPALLSAPALLTGCDSADDPNSGEGHLRIVLKDLPDDLRSAFVTIERIELIGDVNDEDDLDGEDEDGPFVIVFDDPLEIDLLTLQDGVTATLVDDEIPFGHYRQIRWYVGDDAYVVLEDGTEEETEMDLKVPSGKIKIALPEFDIDDDDDFIELLFDFNVEDSFVERGNSGKGYIFKPTLKPERVLVNGIELDLDDEDGD